MVRGWWLGLLALGPASCGAEPGERSLELLDFRQSELGSVGLNEELLFFFSEDLERGSITTSSVQIVGPRGRVVAGKRIVRGNALSFLPELPCASDLSDGGLRPGEEYRVVLGGFPRPDGIRSESGAVLSASLRLAFRTAAIRGTSPLFLDPFTGPYPLIPRGKPRQNEIELEDGLLVLECAEALDPASVPGARFEIVRIPAGASEPERIPLVARLIVNLRDHSELLLEPAGDGLAGRRLAPDRYVLEMKNRELRTLGGRALEPGWPSVLLSVPEVRVELDLAEPRVRSSEQPPGCHGTALWGDAGAPRDEGGLRVRYPAAAGDGLAGEVVLREPPNGADLHATRIEIPAESRVDLSALLGPVVLRSQTVLEVSGRLTRSGAGAKKDPLTVAFDGAASLGEEHWESLSAWVERLLDPAHPDGRPWAHEPWTVLIAGGDIRVPEGGAIEVEGPLVLVAGGWIRVGGTVFSAGDVWKTPEGGGVTSRARVERLPLVLDAPAVNPLRTNLFVGALTQPFPWTPRDDGWRQVFAGHAGSGRLGARFLPGMEGRAEILGDPSELGSGPVRVLLLFELPPGRGEPWSAPRLERLSLEAVPGKLPPGALR